MASLKHQIRKVSLGISLLWLDYPIITVRLVTVSLDSFIMVKDFKITIIAKGEIKKTTLHPTC